MQPCKASAVRWCPEDFRCFRIGFVDGLRNLRLIVEVFQGFSKSTCNLGLRSLEQRVAKRDSGQSESADWQLGFSALGSKEWLKWAKM